MKSTIYHVLDKETNKHHYFGSIVAIFSFFCQFDIGTTPSKLYRYGLENRPFENEFVTIRKGELLRSRQMPK